MGKYIINFQSCVVCTKLGIHWLCHTCEKKITNSTQLWYGNNTGFGIEKIYEEPYLITFETKKGDYASVMIDYRKEIEFHGEGAWNEARKYAEEKLFKKEQAEQEGWIA